MNLSCFLKLTENKIFFCQSNQRFYLTLANLVDIFETLNNIGDLILLGNCINDYDAINAFVAKLELGNSQIQKGNAAFFLKPDIALEKN